LLLMCLCALLNQYTFSFTQVCRTWWALSHYFLNDWIYKICV
jgi:hypothetical protein